MTVKYCQPQHLYESEKFRQVGKRKAYHQGSGRRCGHHVYKAKNRGDETMNEKQTELILAIESSCDETSVAVERWTRNLSNIATKSQPANAFGGSYPAASRHHA